MSGNNRKKKIIPISLQFSLIFIGLMAGVVLLCIVINTFFLSRFYMLDKEKLLKNVYGQIREAASDDLVSSRDFQDKINEFSRANNLSIVIVDSNSDILFSSFNGERDMEFRLLGYILGKDEEGIMPQIITEEDDYVIRKTGDRVMGPEALELMGRFDPGISVLMRIPISSIRESAGFANRFFIWSGLIGAFVGAAIIGIVTSRITRDIEKKSKMDEMRMEFISNVSHELKTPIAIIQGYAEGLKEGITDDPESISYYCDVIMDESNKMNSMVKQFLVLNQLEFGGDVVNIERFCITEMIEGYLSSARVLAEQEGIRVVFEESEKYFVKGDEYKAEEVLTNFYTNAIHYCRPGEDGEKLVKISCEKHDGNIRIKVFNSGEHIPEDSIKRIWEKFYKVDKARTREYGGSGVGLSIVKAIQDYLGKGYGVTNVTGGVEFWFELEEN